MKLLKKITTCLLSLLLVFSIVGCGDKAEQTSSKYKYGKIKIQALGGAVCGAPAYIAYEKGYFKEEGLDAELVSGTLDENKTGLATGEFVVTNGDFQWFPSIQQGLDLKIIGGLHKGCIKIVVPANSPIKKASDLKGKTIGVDEIGGTPMSVATIVLNSAGINASKDVKWAPYPLDQLTSAVDKGEVDAFAAWDPYGTLAVNNNGYRVLTDIATDKLFKGRSCCFLYASQKAIDKNPKKVKAIANAYKKACDWIKAHPEETAKIEIEKKYVAASDVNLLTELIKSYDFEYTTDGAYDDIKYFVKKLDGTDFLKKGTDPNKFAKSTYYDVFKK